jgi:hypothetical protein
MRLMKLIGVSVFISIALLLLAGCEEDAAQPTKISNSGVDQPLWTFKQSQTAIINPVVSSQKSVTDSPAPDSRPVKTGPGPKLTFDKVTHDFGDVNPGSANAYIFTFTNNGNDILKITDVNSTCGCTVSKLPKTEYAPGESGQLAIGYLAGDQLGQTTKQLYVHSNDSSNPQIELSIKSRITTSVDFEPKTVNLMLMQQNGNCPDIKVKSLDNRPFSITSFKSTSDCMSVNFDPSVKSTEFTLKPTVNMKTLENISRGLFEIGTSNPDCKTISGTFNAPARFAATPKSITIYQASQGTSNKKISVVSNYDENFEITSATSRDKIVSVANTTKISKGYELEININAPASSKTKGFTDLLTLKLSNGQVIDIPCNGVLSAKEAAQKTDSESDGECKTCKGPLMINSSGQVVRRNQ